MQARVLRPGFALLLLALCLVAPVPAHTSFGDCNDPAYIARFDPRLASEPDFLCVESDRIAVHSDAGTTHIRIVQHLVADWATRPGAMQGIKDAVAASAREMATLGGFRISDVTILLVDGYSPIGGSELKGDIGAVTDFSPGDECRITMWLLGAGSTVSNGGSVVAHELFHCIQRSSLTAAQLQTSSATGTGGGGTWWTEGSADWFSTVAVSSPRFMSPWVRQFDSESPDKPLNLMSYNAYVFFAWLGGARGRERVLPFLHAMASSRGTSAQHTAMIAALPADQWLRFAQDYLDQAIHDGHGASIGSTPKQGATLTWEHTQTQRIDLAPFVLQRANLSFGCGRWRVESRPARFHAVKPDSGDAWGVLPSGIDAMDGEPRQFRFAGMAVSSSAVALQVTGTQETSCQQCAAVQEIDRCLVGTWQMTVDGMQQWAREHLPNLKITGTSMVGNTLTLGEDRSFRTGASHVSASGTLRGGDPGIHSTAQLGGQLTGRWSAAGGQLNLCPDAGTVGGTVTTVVHGHAITTPMPVGPLRDYSQAYDCSASTLRVTTPMPRAGAVTSVYTKVATPP